MDDFIFGQAVERGGYGIFFDLSEAGVVLILEKFGDGDLVEKRIFTSNALISA